LIQRFLRINIILIVTDTYYIFSLYAGTESGEGFGGGVGSADSTETAVRDPHPEDSEVV
jgi:hypothetical protein